MLYNTNNFYIQEMMTETDLAAMPYHRAEKYQRVQHLAKEFDLMMYGNKVRLGDIMSCLVHLT
jgi:hypothetical protein